jgi:hypothetical protein
MMNNNNLASGQELLGNDDRSKSVCGSATGVADDVAVSLFEAQGAGRIDPSVHAYYDEYFPIIHDLSEGDDKQEVTR